MSNYNGYNEIDNMRRKKNNMSTSEYESKANPRTKRYTTSGSALSEHIRKQEAKKHTGECKVYSLDEIRALNEQRKKVA